MSEWRKAQSLGEGWRNFNPNLPLESNSPFYVKRDDSPLGKLKQALLWASEESPRPEQNKSQQPLQFYFSGFKGTGKSTELKKLSTDPDIEDKYFVVNFSVKEKCDQNDINYVDILATIGTQLFDQCKTEKIRLDEGIYTELLEWGQRTLTRVEQSSESASLETEAKAKLSISALVASIMTRVSAVIENESTTRETLRTVLEPNLTELLSKIHLITSGIRVSTGKQVLVIIDDLDKPRPEQIEHLFQRNLAAFQRLEFCVIYTVPEWIFLSPDYSEVMSTNSHLLPNISIHLRGKRDQLTKRGKAIMQEMIERRMAQELITGDAREEAIRMSGGVFRELARIIYVACGNAADRESNRIELKDIHRAVIETRNSLSHMLSGLTPEECNNLCGIYKSSNFRPSGDLSRMLRAEMLLVYMNEMGDNWFDIHPALEETLKEWCKSKKPAKKPSSRKSS